MLTVLRGASLVAHFVRAVSQVRSAGRTLLATRRFADCSSSATSDTQEDLLLDMYDVDYRPASIDCLCKMLLRWVKALRISKMLNLADRGRFHSVHTRGVQWQAHVWLGKSSRAITSSTIHRPRRRKTVTIDGQGEPRHLVSEFALHFSRGALPIRVTANRQADGDWTCVLSRLYVPRARLHDGPKYVKARGSSCGAEGKGQWRMLGRLLPRG